MGLEVLHIWGVWIAFQVSLLDRAFGYAPRLVWVTGGVLCLGKAEGCIQQSGKDVGEALLWGRL